jgi:hypothetical protein
MGKYTLPPSTHHRYHNPSLFYCIMCKLVLLCLFLTWADIFYRGADAFRLPVLVLCSHWPAFDVGNAYVQASHRVGTKAVMRMLSMKEGDGDKPRTIPRPNVITPSQGSTQHDIEKFLMMYTCKICQGRNAQMVWRALYTRGQ